MTFENAKALYVHRFTMEHVPAWARKPLSDGRFYAPQYSSDREWFEHTLFPPNNPLGKRVSDCYSSGQTWPLGQWLDAPYTRVR